MSDFVMPSLGADMDSGKLVEWKVKPGDRVSKGQVVAAVETSKAVLDVEVFEAGVVEELYVAEDTEVTVGTPLARIGDGSGVGAAPEAKTAESRVEAEPEKALTEEAKAAPEEQVSAPDRETVATPPPDSAPAPGRRQGGRIAASPAARRRARELSVDLAGISGSGPDGAIVLRDLERAPAAAPRKPAGGFDRAAMRETIAAAMSRSKREIPHYYVGTTVDLHAVDLWLEEYNREQPPEKRILIAALFMKATALALARYSELNGHYGEDGFVAAGEVNPGMAVHLRGGGLVAPAILEADTLTLPELMHRLQDLVRRARGGGLRGSEIGGGTATVTSLGDRGVDTVYGVIYPPQVAMIGFGRPCRRALVVDDGIAARLAVDVTLSADHRVCDGHLGTLFLNEIDNLLQTPEAL